LGEAVKTAKTEVNWQAVGALAAVASAVIALLAFASHAQSADSSTAPPTAQSSAEDVPSSTTVPLSSLPDPCLAPTADTIDSFRNDPAQPDVSDTLGKGCHWSTLTDNTDDFFDLIYFPFYSAPDPASSPISLSGLPHATEHPYVNTCQIAWPTSFGSILVTADATPRGNEQVAPADPCVDARNWVASLLPSLPN
jgi:hypothetical protein